MPEANYIDIPFRVTSASQGGMFKRKSSGPSFTFENVIDNFEKENGSSWFPGSRTSIFEANINLGVSSEYQLHVDPNYLGEEFTEKLICKKPLSEEYKQISISGNPKFWKIVDALRNSDFQLVEMEPGEYWSNKFKSYAIPVSLADDSYLGIIFLEAWESLRTKDQFVYANVSLISTSRRSIDSEDKFLPSAYTTIPALVERIMFSAEKFGSSFTENPSKRLEVFSAESSIKPAELVLDLRSNFVDTNVWEDKSEYKFSNLLVPEVARVGYLLTEAHVASPGLLESVCNVLIHALNSISDAYSNSPHDEEEYDFQVRAVCMKKEDEEFSAWALPLYLPSHYWFIANSKTSESFKRVSESLDEAVERGDEEDFASGLQELVDLVYDGVSSIQPRIFSSFLYNYSRFVNIFDGSPMSEQLDEMIGLAESLVKEPGFFDHASIYTYLAANLNHAERHDEAAICASLALQSVTSWLSETPAGLSKSDSASLLLDRMEPAAWIRVEATLELCSALASEGKLVKARKEIETAITLGEGYDFEERVDFLREYLGLL